MSRTTPQHFLFWVELGAALFKSIGQLVKHVGWLVFKLGLLEESHNFFFGLGD